MGGFGAPAAATWDSLASYDQEEVVSYELRIKSTMYAFVGGDWTYNSDFNSLVGDNPA